MNIYGALAGSYQRSRTGLAQFAHSLTGYARDNARIQRLVAFVRAFGPLIAALGIFAWYTVPLVVDTVSKQHGHLIYALDDPYIHMAIAKNLARHGMWGISPNEFSAASSSPAWTILLAGIYLFTGPSEIAPFVLNLISVVLLLGVMDFFMRRSDVPLVGRLAALAGAVLLTPLPVLVMTGQEHTLHAAITVAVAGLAALLCADDRARLRSGAGMTLLALCAVLPVMRYEGVFLILMVCAVFVLRGRWSWALLIALVAGLPVLLYGGVLVLHTGHWVPNSVLLKSRLSVSPTLGGAIDPTLELLNWINIKWFYWESLSWDRVHITLPVFAAVVAILVRSARRPLLKDAPSLLLLMFAGASLLHLRFAAVGWFYRYESYLLPFGMLGLVWAAGDIVPHRLYLSVSGLVRGVVVVAVVIAFYDPAIQRAWDAYHQVPQAMHNIYGQQYQMGRFLHRFYNTSSVALNDVGATSFLTESRVFDVWGLGTNEVTTARLSGVYDSQMMAQMARQRGVQVAVTYAETLRDFGGVPRDWIAVGSWTLQAPLVAVALLTVTFYAVDPDQVNPLAVALAAFQPALPENVATTLFIPPYISNDVYIPQ